MIENKSLSDSLDFVAEVFEPLMSLCQSEKIKAVMKKDRMQIAAVAIAEKKAEVIAIIEAFDRADGKQIEYNGVTLMIRLLEILGTYGDTLKPFFTSQGQTMAAEFSGSHTESTAEKEN